MQIESLSIEELVSARDKVSERLSERVQARQDELKLNPRYIPHPSTFLNQERWKSEPPASEPKPGGIRLRETTPVEKAEAAERIKFLDLLRANPGKSEADIRTMMRAA
jgi:hypothetical protein